MNASPRTLALATLSALAVVAVSGCLSVKTESEVKPIHITMDINLKVDKELDKSFANESMTKPKGEFAAVKEMLDRKTAGITKTALLEARSGATDDDKILVAETNARWMRKFEEIAKASGVSVEAVQKRYAKMSREHLPDGCGVWYQDDSGKWLQK